MERSHIQNPPRKRGSCLGDLGKLFALLVLLALGYLAVIAVFAPWMYFLGGSFHLIPIWQGVGKFHTSSGDFTLYVYLSQPGTSRLGHPDISGTAALCTPHGEQFNTLRLTVSLPKDFGLDSNHQPVIIHVYNYGASAKLSADNRPEFNLYGTWQDPNLVLEDHGSLASAFLADGQAYLGPGANQPPAGENLSITLVPGNPAQLKTACPSGH